MENETVSKNFIEQMIDKDIEEGYCHEVIPDSHRNQMVTFILDMQSPFF